MSSSLQAACVQMCSDNDMDNNLNKAASLLKEAAMLGAQLSLLPENFSFMAASDHEKQTHAEHESDSKSLTFLSQQAKQHCMWIVGGSVTLQSKQLPKQSPKQFGKLRNVCPVFSPDGECVNMYDKMHLFDVDLQGEACQESYRESDLIVAGNTPTTVDCHDWKIGLSICYDLRFPELYRLYAQQKCQILTVPAAFTAITGQAHWQTLLTARAIENQCYVLAAGQCGEHPGQRKTWGHSMMIDPWGKTLAETSHEEGVIIATLEQDKLLALRQSMPVLQHRKM